MRERERKCVCVWVLVRECEWVMFVCVCVFVRVYTCIHSCKQASGIVSKQDKCLKADSFIVPFPARLCVPVRVSVYVSV